MKRKIVLALLAVLVIIQFIRPAKNQAEGISETDVSKVYALPPGMQDILKTKCYDCHSNNTVYPWYYNIQPVAWWMAYHVKNAKKELNFSVIGEYPKKRVDHKLEEILEVLDDGSMPIKSYLWMHQYAKVTPEEAAIITRWINSMGIHKK
jgi:Haem-binding domain